MPTVELCQRRDTCRLCGSGRMATVLELAPSPPANAFVAAADLAAPQPKYPLEIGFCRDCCHVQLMHVVDAAHLFSNYVYVSGTSPAFVRHFDGYAAAAVDRVGLAPGDLVVEIGSNDGTLLRAFQGHGMKVLGIDPARKIAEAANAAGIETWPRFFDAAAADEVRSRFGAAKCIAANNVMAHIDALGDTIDAVAGLLSPDGVLVFEVSDLADVIEHTLFDTIYHEHLDYHSVAPLIPFFRAHGMELVHVEHVGTHGGSLRGYAAKAGGPHTASPAVAAFVAREQALGLDRAETLVAYAEAIDALGSEVRGFLEDVRGQGKTVAGYGAPAKATTLMHQFRLDADMIDFIVDESPWKQGLFTPGLHIPVVAGDEVAARRPDYLVIFAWNFAESIMQSNAAFLERGGHFVVPVPRLIVH